MASSQRIKINQDGTVVVPSEWIVARISQVGSTQLGSGQCVGYPHAWIEQRICNNSFKYEDNTIDGDSGTLTVQPAFSMDGTKANLNDIVMMRQRSLLTNGQTVYEFFKGSGGPILSIQVVTDITCVSGVLTVTKKTIQIPGGIST